MKHYFRCLVGIAAVLMLALSMGCSHHNAEEENSEEIKNSENNNDSNDSNNSNETED